MRILSLICSISLLVGLFTLPIGYYTFLRILVFTSSILVIVKGYNGSFNLKFLVFGIAAILFNPIIPVYLGNRDLWAPIDIIVAILFIIDGFQQQRGSTLSK